MILLLAFTGLLFIFLEFFLPGAIMAVGGTIMLLISLFLVYWRSSGSALFFLYFAGLVIATILVIIWALLRVKKGKVLHSSDQEGFLACEYPKDMLNRTATVVSDLKPSGYIEIDGRTFSALSSLGYIEKGMIVRVIGGQGTHLIVNQEKSHHDASTNSGAGH